MIVHGKLCVDDIQVSLVTNTTAKHYRVRVTPRDVDGVFTIRQAVNSTVTINDSAPVNRNCRAKCKLRAAFYVIIARDVAAMKMYQ